jgi:hypothetical protein
MLVGVLRPIAAAKLFPLTTITVSNGQRTMALERVIVRDSGRDTLSMFPSFHLNRIGEGFFCAAEFDEACY